MARRPPPAPPRPPLHRMPFGRDNQFPDGLNEDEFHPKGPEFKPRFPAEDLEVQQRPPGMEAMQPPFQERMPMRPAFAPQRPSFERPQFGQHGLVRPPNVIPPNQNVTVPAPPIVDKDGNMWLEARSAEGKVYYFNARTRETKWEKPESSSDALLPTPNPTQSVDQIPNNENNEMEDSKQGQTTTAQSNDSKIHPDREEVISKAVAEESIKSENDNSDVKTGTAFTPGSNSQPDMGHPQQLRIPPNMQRPHLHQPGQLFTPPGMHHGLLPQLNNPQGFPISRPPVPPPGLLLPPGMGIPVPNVAPPSFPGMPLPPFGQMNMHPQMPVTDWTEHRLPDGRIYYYNSKTLESTWDRPKELDALQEAANKDRIKQQEKRGGYPGSDEINGFKMETEDPDGIKKDGRKDKPGFMPIQLSEASKSKEESTSKDDQSSTQTPGKPVANAAIPGTGWHVVWTADSKYFFFNPTSKTSIWDRPTELEKNSKVDDIVKAGPEAKQSEDLKQSHPTPTKLDEEPAPKKSKLEEEEIVEVKDTDEIEQERNKDEEKQMEVDEKLQKERDAEVKKLTMSVEDRMAEFRVLLLEKGVSAFSTWEKELHKIVFDSRYLLLNMRERKQCFEKFVRSRADDERRERKVKSKEKKEEFRKLIEEFVSNEKTSFSEFSAKSNKDPRFKLIDKSREREGMFNEFMLDFRKNQREKVKAREEKIKNDFNELLGELKGLDKKSDWRKVKASISKDPRYDAVESSRQREALFMMYVEHAPVQSSEKDSIREQLKELRNDEEKKKEKNKQDRIEASIKHREEDVRAKKQEIDRERQLERGVHLHEKAVQNFKALLADMVRDPGLTWKETRRALRKDPRWEALEVLSKPEKEEVFIEHIKDLNRRKREQFRKLLEEAEIPLDVNWKDVKRNIRHDSRYERYGTSERREQEFNDFMRERIIIAKGDFRTLLRETKLITHKTKRKIDDHPSHLKSIVEILKKDKRYLLLEPMEEDRMRMMRQYFDELHKKGTPPPPTATHPSARYKKD